MFSLENFLSHEVVQKLGWALLHFTWQATAAALLTAVLLRILRRFSANLRYVTACLALAIIVLMPVITLQVISVPTLTPPVKVNTESSPSTVIMPTQPEREITVGAARQLSLTASCQKSARVNYFAALKQKAGDFLEPALPHIVTIWLLGVFALSIWHLGGWTQLQRLRKKMARQVDASLKTKLYKLSEKLGVRQAVELLESALVQIPTVVGWLRPVILLPASALTGLDAEQLEAILAHELAHIKRYDYLVNMLQTVVEILGFYHPAVWWISHKIRAERENCCDDLAVTVTGDRLRYARALTSMEEIRSRSELVVAVTGGNLFSRIRRLIGKDSNEKTLSWAPAVIVILLFVVLTIPTTLALTIKQTERESDAHIGVKEENPIGRRMDNNAFFKQPVTRNINSVVELKDCFIDFDNNKLFSQPDNFDSLSPEQQKAWKQENGIDASGSTSDGGEGLWGEQMVVIPVANEEFDRTTPSSFRDILQQATSGNPAVMTAIGKLPNTYVFKTQKGGMGLLQILEVQKKQKPNYIKIRYKMVPRTTESDDRIISDKKIQDLGKVMVLYCTRHQGNLPDNLQDFTPLLSHNLDIDWLSKNVEYLGKGKTEKDMPDTIIAYDRSLLQSQQGTNVLFLDGHVEFVEAEKLKKLSTSHAAVQIEMRLMYVNEEFMKEAGKSLNFKLDPNTPLDDLLVGLLIQAARVDKGTKMLAAPKVTVLDNEQANFFIGQELPSISGYTEPNSPDEEPKPIIDYKTVGTICDLTPHVSPDQKNVLLEFKLELSQLKGFEERLFQGKYKEQVPQIETSTIVTSKSIPDGKTLFYDGGITTLYEQKTSTSGEKDYERIPEKKRLIILIKPTILSPEQAEALGLDKTPPPTTMGGYDGELPPGFGGMGGSSYGSPPPEILKRQSAGKPMTIVYDISDLINTSDDVNDLIRRIKENVEPDSWYDNNNKALGTISAFPAQTLRKLAIYQSFEVHQKIQKLLNIMRPSSGEEYIPRAEPTFPKNWDEIKKSAEQIREGQADEDSKSINTLKNSEIPAIPESQSLSEIENQDQLVQKFFKLKYILSSKMAQVIQPLISEHGYVHVDERQNALLVVETVRNLIRIENIINKFDVAGETTVLKIFDIHHGDPAEIIRLTRILLDAEEGTLKNEIANGNTPIVLIPVPEHKWIIAKGPAKAMTQIEQWVQKLDRQETTEKNHEAVVIKYIDVTEAAKRINKVLKQDPNLSGRVLVTPLSQARQLLIFGSKDDREFVKKLIRELDVNSEQPTGKEQILIDTEIIRTSDKFLKFIGLDDDSLKHSNTWSKYLALNPDDFPMNNTAIFEIDQLQAALLIKTASAREDFKRSAKFQLRVMEGNQAKIPVSDKQYHVISAPQKTNEAIPKQKLELLETGDYITVTPELTEDGKNIQLDLELKTFQKDDDYNRSITTGRIKFRIQDSKILLIRPEKITETTEGQSHTPILGDIPLIGGVFRSKYKITEEYTPLILIQPTIITQEELDQAPLVKN